ncbi:acyl-CoA synthetase [Noviherbaspirillum autotrophicum]|uniref:AMP-binding protein n=1 Tax=Noviherbaspirillum autotrophicum TaxID=709839 RepID=A0A0C2BS08_9BURK|nr:AMP-binding protein [Noviherbaspirillum autotrophicum]KIF80851.1 AMP-binding protein [Noviherbaspirillum autotrophicum]
MPSAERPQPNRYEALYSQFRWLVPSDLNIAEVCCTRWASDKSRVAIHYEDDAGHCATLTYAQLHAQANRLANVLRDLGVGRGDRVAIILPQRPETAVAHIACYRLGAVAMPLSMLFGPDALEYRLQNSEASIAVVDQAGYQHLQQARTACPALKNVIALGGDADDTLDWDSALAKASEDFDPVRTRASDPAVLIYTSGTTGAPKGALIPHSAIIGNLPGFVASQNWFPQEADVFWSPADWAWTGGLWDALLPTLYFGKPILGYRGRFSADTAFYLLEKYRVTNTFLFPTALKMMMKAYPAPGEKFSLRLRAIMSAGEAVGDTVFNWCQSALGITPNEMFGQTEMNYIVGNSAQQWPAKPGSMGRPYPGHRIALIDDDGREVGTGEVGEVALNRTDMHGHPDPIFFIGYWKNPDATRNKYSGDWCRTGDLALMDEDGYLWYQGRADDMFKAAGYRIGPSEIENCLVNHPAVANAAVVPKPDAERGNVVKAYVVLTPGTERGRDAEQRLIAELQAHVRGKLAPYEYPKEIEFIDELPMTTTGKVQRRVLRLMEQERASRTAAQG